MTKDKEGNDEDNDDSDNKANDGGQQGWRGQLSTQVACSALGHCTGSAPPHTTHLCSCWGQLLYSTDTIHLHSVSSLTLSIVVPAWSCTDTTDIYRTQRLDVWPYVCAWSQVLCIAQEEAMASTSTVVQVAQLHVATIKATISPKLSANDPFRGEKETESF